MSEFLLSKYRPEAVELLAAHGLAVDDSVLDLLASTIAHSREPVEGEHDEEQAALAAARSARKHISALQRYQVTPPARPSSIANRSAKLRQALANSRLALELGIVDIGEAVDPAELAAGLERAPPAFETLRALNAALAAVIDDSEGRQKGGRPAGHTRGIVRTGCIVWLHSGQAKLGFTWDPVADELSGALPSFLRNLLASCAVSMTAAAMKQAIVASAPDLQKSFDSHT